MSIERFEELLDSTNDLETLITLLEKEKKQNASSL